MCWRGYSLYNCTSEFRFFWGPSKLLESKAVDPPSHFHRFRFAPLAVRECSADGLESAYSDTTPFQKNGLLFFNKHAQYTLGLTPLALLWKDACCSKYVIDTDPLGRIPPQQLVTLVLEADGTLVTSDDPPVVLWTLADNITAENGQPLRPGSLLRFSLPDSGVHLKDEQLELTGLQYVGGVRRREGGSADSCSKILFQHAARQGDAISLTDLMTAAEDSAGAMERETTLEEDARVLGDQLADATM
eukprot:TRINITY_DN8408_c0_g1_i1.p1 TRINITY_DN8408_c0_g1~~TRINITY_DN8408_c0_g1_i1.p1  ORF type:complete len:246 (+),score=39.53 TRINITY_DN8408_c0_g1_i1:305-1042(+)